MHTQKKRSKNRMLWTDMFISQIISWLLITLLDIPQVTLTEGYILTLRETMMMSTDHELLANVPNKSPSATP